MTSDDNEIFKQLLDPETDLNAVYNQRKVPDLELLYVDDKIVEKTQFSSIHFHDINGVQLGFFPSSEEQRNFGILRFLPHSRKAKTSNDSTMLFLILTGKFKFKFGRESQEMDSGMVKVPAGEQFEIISISDKVGLIQFLMINNPEE